MAGFSKHDPDKGTNREQILIDILNDHLPESLNAISGGTIFNLDGKTSGQLDIIVRNDTFPVFGSLVKPMVPIEAVVGAIEVKSYLDTPKLKGAIELLRDIPAWDDRTVASTGSNRFGFPNGEELTAREAYEHNFPFRAVYAYNGNRTDTLYKEMRAFFNKHNDKDKLPRMVAVNKKCNIRYLPKGGQIAKGCGAPEPAPDGWMHPLKLTQFTQGYTLAGMITALTSYIAHRHGVIFNFAPYVDAMAEHGLKALEKSRSDRAD